MSGGHFDYNCYRIANFAEELECEIRKNDDKTMDEYGDIRGAGFDAETMSRLVISHEIISLAAKLAKEIEWLYSGDSGEEDFVDMFDKHVSYNFDTKTGTF